MIDLRPNYRHADAGEIARVRDTALRAARSQKQALENETVVELAKDWKSGSVSGSSLHAAVRRLAPFTLQEAVEHKTVADAEHTYVTTRPRAEVLSRLQTAAIKCKATLSLPEGPADRMGMYDFVVGRGSEHVFGKIVDGPHLLPEASEELPPTYANGLDGSPGFPTGFAGLAEYGEAQKRIRALRAQQNRTVVRLEAVGKAPASQNSAPQTRGDSRARSSSPEPMRTFFRPPVSEPTPLIQELDRQWNLGPGRGQDPTLQVEQTYRISNALSRPSIVDSVDAAKIRQSMGFADTQS